MEGPIISIDVSDRSSHYILFEKNNKKLGGVHKINHDVEGFDHLKKDIEMLSEKTGSEVCAVYEKNNIKQRLLKKSSY